VNLSLDIKRLYALAGIFLVYCLAAVYFDALGALLLPVAIGMVWLLVVQPKYILYFLAFATPLSVHLIDERVSTVNVSLPTEPLIILLFFGVLFKLLASRSLLLPEVKTILSILILVDFGWLIVTAIFSSMPLISAKYVLMKSWYLVVFYFLLSRYFRDQQMIKKFIWIFISAIVILTLYTLYHHAVGGFSREYAYTAMRPFLPDHGMYAACITFIVPVLFVFAIHGEALGYGKVLRIVCGFLFIYMIIAVALSFTRAAWLSLALAFGVYLLFLLQVRFKHILLLAVVVVGAVLVNLDSLLIDLSRNKNESDDNIENHLQSVSNVTSDPSNLERLNRWGSAVRLWEEKPFLGWGPGTYTFQYGQFQLANEMTIISTNAGTMGGVHSEYLRPLAESGLFGALSYLVLVVWAISLGFKQQRLFSGSAKYLSMAVFLALITYFAHGVLNNYTEFDKIAVPLYSFLAVLTALEVAYQNDKKTSKE
jgi:putative inorganic carbon (HCO3(-)) transporter